MKKHIKSFLLAITSLLLTVSCMDSYLGIEQIKIDDNAPNKVTVNQIIPKSGALEIHFSLPRGNPNIAQVVATYVNKHGKLMEFKASRYTSSILVEGFTGTDEVTVELTCIDASGNKSDINYLTGAPLLSPAELAFNSIKAESAFGGVKVEWQNAEGQPLVIHVLVEEVLQKGVTSLIEDPAKTIYNRDAANTAAYLRQYPPVEKKFGFVISDKWGNRTDTLLTVLTPYEEELIDHRLVRHINYFGHEHHQGNREYNNIYGFDPVTGIQKDANTHAATNGPITMFDNTTTGNQFYAYKFFHNTTPRVMVHDAYATFNLNMDLRLSRVRIFPRAGNYAYGRSSIKRFRIWGTNDANSERATKFPDGWTLIGEYVGRDAVNPADPTPEELEWFRNTQDYLISEENVNLGANPTTSFRYMRLQMMESYNPNETFYTINEFQMFGQVERVY